MVSSASRQLVSGYLYVIDCKVGHLCPNALPKFKNCALTVWDRPWIYKGRNFSVSCENVHFDLCLDFVPLP